MSAHSGSRFLVPDSCNSSGVKLIILLHVDGESLSINETQRLLQLDPFPGGHIYDLLVEGPSVLTWFDGLESTTNPTREEQWRIFFAIDRIVGTGGQASRRTKYLLNSVETLMLHGRRAQIAGVCSRVQEEGVAVLGEEPVLG